MKKPVFSSRFLGWRVGTAALLAAVAMLGTVAFASPPPGYYATVDDSNPTVLRNSLHAIISNHTVRSYNAAYDIIADANEDPNNSNNVILFYTGRSVPKSLKGGNDGSTETGGYNREHLFPQSAFNSQSPMVSDMHGLMPTDADANGRRSNYPFDDVTGTPTWSDIFGNKVDTSGDPNIFEPRDAVKGDVARALFYMDVRYDGSGGERDLFLSDIDPLGTGSNKTGMLSTLLQWHLDDPVDDFERARNEHIYGEQNNRNPFVDNPDWVDCVYNGNCLDVTPPGVPTGLSAFGTDGLVILSWNENLDADLDGYRVYRSLTPGSGYVEISGGLLPTAGFDDTAVTNGTTYYYVVTAEDESGNESAFSAEASATPDVDVTPPAAPTGVSAVAGNGVVSLDWDPGSEPDLATYRVLRSTTSGSGYAEIAGSPLAGTSISDTTVTNGITYFYVVRAEDLSGNISADSTEVAATPGVVSGTPVFINEIDYDQIGTDDAEFIEIAGPAGTSLDGWTLHFYNGASTVRDVYGTWDLAGTIPNQQSGFGTLAFFFPPNSLQNGAPDGVALTDASDTLVQFLSWEGTFIAAGGPANTLESEDIGVEDSNSVDGSLYLVGTGTVYEDFTWTGPGVGLSPDAVNDGQVFSGGPPPDTTPPDVDSITLVNDSPTNLPAVQFAVTFTEDVTGVDAGDFAVSGTGATGASVDGVTGSGAAYTVTVLTGADGTLRLDLVDDDSIQDGAGNPLGGTGAQDFTSGPSYLVDKSAPEIVSPLAPTQGEFETLPVAFEITFDEEVFGLEAAVSLATSTAPGTLTATVSQVARRANATYRIEVSGATGGGDVIVRLDLEQVSDALGNPMPDTEVSATGVYNPTVAAVSGWEIIGQ